MPPSKPGNLHTRKSDRTVRKVKTIHSEIFPRHLQIPWIKDFLPPHSVTLEKSHGLALPPMQHDMNAFLQSCSPRTQQTKKNDLWSENFLDEMCYVILIVKCILTHFFDIHGWAEFFKEGSYFQSF